VTDGPKFVGLTVSSGIRASASREGVGAPRGADGARRVHVESLAVELLIKSACTQVSAPKRSGELMNRTGVFGSLTSEDPRRAFGRSARRGPSRSAWGSSPARFVKALASTTRTFGAA